MNIIELAKQSGLKRHQEQAPGIDGVVGNWADLETFAALVEAAVRADEREACAKLVEPTEEHRREALYYIGGEEGVELLDNRAADIRARGNT